MVSTSTVGTEPAAHRRALRTRTPAAWAAIAVLLLFFPANVYAAFERVAFGGHAWGPAYLLARAPLQAIIVA